MLNTLKKYSIHALLAVGFILLSYILLQKYQFVTGIVSSTLYICFYFSLFISFFIAETYLLAKKAFQSEFNKYKGIQISFKITFFAFSFLSIVFVTSCNQNLTIIFKDFISKNSNNAISSLNSKNIIYLKFLMTEFFKFFCQIIAIAFLLISIIKIVIKFHTYFIYKKYSLTPNFLNNTSNINLNEKNLDYKNLYFEFLIFVLIRRISTIKCEYIFFRNSPVRWDYD